MSSLTSHLWQFRYVLSRLKIKVVCFYKCLGRSLRLGNKKINKYPTVIQLPITYKCNFNCKMCGMQNLVRNKDYSAAELETILNDRLFHKISSIGLNGGEPFLRPDLIECVKVMINTLPKLKSFNIISNGYFTNSIKEKLSQIYELAKQHDIKVNISFSVDGIYEMQDYMRGHKNAWDNVINTINCVNANKGKYCDSISIICTVTKYNVYNLEEVEAWGKKNNLLIRYNIATLNIRIANEDRYEDFSIFFDEKARLVAQEFFYKKAMQDNSETYFGLYLFIHTRKRYAYCPCKYNEWVTLVPNGNISYCATYSKELGNALENSAYELFNNNVGVLNDIIYKHCDNCSHYISKLDAVGLKMFYKELSKNGRIMF